MDKTTALNIYRKIERVIDNPVSELRFNNPYELLVAVILSAQCTDKRVNIVTEGLFKKYPNVESMANADLTELESIIKPCGFYKNKAKNISNACKKLILWYNSEVPKTMDELLSLDGVGRKTANVVLAVAFNTPALAVDTHVRRVSNRLGFANTSDVDKIEIILKKTFPKDEWIKLHHTLLLFGRYVCQSRSPHCVDCVASEDCKYYKSKRSKDKL